MKKGLFKIIIYIEKKKICVQETLTEPRISLGRPLTFN